MLIMQNLASNPNISCSSITDEVIMMGFLYLMSFSFMGVKINSSLRPVCRQFRPW